MSIKLRIALVTALFLACALLVLSVFTYRAQRKQLQAELVRKQGLALSMLSEMTAPYLRQGDILTLANIADRAASGQPERVFVADRQGIILADSRHELYGESTRPIRAAYSSGRRYIRQRGEVMEGAAPVSADGVLIGIVSAEFSTHSMDEALGQARTATLIFASASILLAAIVGYATGRQVSRSLSPLLEGIRRAGSADFETVIPVIGITELDEIGRAFNKMARLVGRQVRDLATFNELSAKLSVCTTPEEFATALDQGTANLLPARSSLLLGDPTSGTITLVGGQPDRRMVSPLCAAFRCIEEHRVLIIGRSGELPVGSQVAEGFKVQSAVLAPMITPESDAVGVLVVEFEAEQHPTPSMRDAETVAAMANLAGPILAALTRSWASERAVGALKEILLPETIPQPSGIEVFGYFQPAEAESGLGGDYYDVLQISENVWGFAIGDVSGKGLDAGRYTAMTKYVIRSYAMEYRSPARAMAQADRTLAIQMGDPHFVTIFFGVINTSSSKLTYCCAGHVPGVLHSPATGETRELEMGGGLVGLALPTGYTEESVPLRVGDVLLLATDGVTEARSEREEYGMERLKTVLRANADRTLREIATSITEDVRAFAGNIVRDDMTLLLARVMGDV